MRRTTTWNPSPESPLAPVLRGEGAPDVPLTLPFALAWNGVLQPLQGPFRRLKGRLAFHIRFVGVGVNGMGRVLGLAVNRLPVVPTHGAHMLADVVFLRASGIVPAGGMGLVCMAPVGGRSVIAGTFGSGLTGIPVLAAVVPGLARIPVAAAVVPIPSVVIAIPIPASVVPVSVASAVVPVPEVAARVLSVARRPAFIVARIAPILTHVVVAAAAAKVQAAGALGDLICAHGLKPVNSIRQFRTVDALPRPPVDDLAQSVTERRPARERG
jgi:hypothetical protein